MIREREMPALPGIPIVALLIVVLGVLVFLLIDRGDTLSAAQIVTFVLLILLDVFLMIGLFIVNPNEGRVLQLFGDYVGTVKRPGLRWSNPLYTKKRIS